MATLFPKRRNLTGMMQYFGLKGRSGFQCKKVLHLKPGRFKRKHSYSDTRQSRPIWRRMAAFGLDTPRSRESGPRSGRLGHSPFTRPKRLQVHGGSRCEPATTPDFPGRVADLLFHRRDNGRRPPDDRVAQRLRLECTMEGSTPLL